MIIYLVLANIYLAIFYTFYHIFLRKETFFRLNRLFLLSSIVLSFSLPLININPTNIYSGQLITELATNLPDMLTQKSGETIAMTELSNTIIEQNHLQAPERAPRHQIFELYLLGCTLSLFLFCIRIALTVRAFRHRQSTAHAFSFLGKTAISPDLDGYNQILSHEKVHAREWHSLDLILIQIVRIFNWFNPFIYVLERSLKLQHEYHADAQAAKQNEIAYAELLLANALGTTPHSLIHQFSQPSQLKSRIQMLLKGRTPKRHLTKLLFVLPILSGMLVLASACNQNQSGTVKDSVHADSSATTAPANERMDSSKNEPLEVLRVNRVETAIPASDQIELPPIFMTESGATDQLGYMQFRQWLHNHLEIPKKLIEDQFAGTVWVSFVVDDHGRLSRITLENDPGYGMLQAVQEALLKSPPWKPGIQNGEPVASVVRIPLRLDNRR